MATPNMNLRCICNTFAIGTCADCEVDVCGDHSGLYESTRLCAQHLESRRDAAKVSEADAQAEVLAGRREVVRSAAADRRELTQSSYEGLRKDHTDPVSQVVIDMLVHRADNALRYRLENETLRIEMGGSDEVMTIARWIELHLDQIDEGYPEPSLANLQVVDWFLEHVNEPPVDRLPVKVQKRQVLGGMKSVDKEVLGWRVSHGFITASGNVYRGNFKPFYGPGHPEHTAVADQPRFTGYELADMGRRLGWEIDQYRLIEDATREQIRSAPRRLRNY